jgi:hypothetical protein
LAAGLATALAVVFARVGFETAAVGFFGGLVITIAGLGGGGGFARNEVCSDAKIN